LRHSLECSKSGDRGDRDYPAAVLIRGAGSVSGPGKLTKLLHIDGTLHGKRAVPENHLWIADRGAIVPESQILQTPRIGVDYAGEWAQKPWRFLLSAAEIQV
ncbi:MAG: hypothetical protein HC925_07660, partial [Coleofasciculaceae cyanobacterium SM2_3_26]|nr:hypothetical protein [Coleofasciculaceae cyanobacterium SM2_3_26]